ncbi:MAG: hypothetical protein RL751_1999 [Bacteroidota bacterium]|jgi:hypothetical protein
MDVISTFWRNKKATPKGGLILLFEEEKIDTKPML